jgi:hypothetical protein
VLPSAGDWTLPKTTPTSLAEFRKEHFEAHSEWAHHLLSDAAVSPATRFVDPGRIRKAVQSHRNSDRPSDLRGVREAFGCYAIKLGL